MTFSPLTLTPAAALILFVIAVVAGTQYRRVWKAEGPRAHLWVYGAVAGACLLAVGLIPLSA